MIIQIRYETGYALFLKQYAYSHNNFFVMIVHGDQEILEPKVY